MVGLVHPFISGGPVGIGRDQQQSPGFGRHQHLDRFFTGRRARGRQQIELAPRTMVTLAPAPSNVEPPGLGQLHNLVVVSTCRQLISTAGIVLHPIRQGLKLGDLVEETDQILFRHGATAQRQ